jgi:hypothetical protein
VPSTREDALNAIKVGDVIFGISAGGNGKLLLVSQASQTSIFARHVTSQSRAEFGRNGKSRWCEGGGSCTIVSTAILPPEEYAVVIGLDRKRQQARGGADQRLTKAEIQLILTYEDFFKARPLPDAEPSR